LRSREARPRYICAHEGKLSPIIPVRQIHIKEIS
jgi:hypothetical protein